MFFKLRPLLSSIIFLASLEIIIFGGRHIFAVVFFLFLFAMYEGRKIGKKWIFSILPVFFVLSSATLLYLISEDLEQQIFIFLASAMFYLSLFSAYRLGQYSGDQTAKGMNIAAAFATIFFSYASTYGIYLNFLVPLYYLMLVYMLVTLLVSYQYFVIIKKDDLKKTWTYSFLLALIMSEMIWAMNFWVFGYLTTGVIALILYYILWDLTQSYFLNLLSRRRVIANMAFFSILISMVLLTSKWTPVI